MLDAFCRGRRVSEKKFLNDFIQHWWTFLSDQLFLDTILFENKKRVLKNFMSSDITEKNVPKDENNR
jgi:hypothetical protein